MSADFPICSCIYCECCAIIDTAKKLSRVPLAHKRQTPGEIGTLRGSNLAGAGLLLLVVLVPIKPLADIVGSYTRYDRHQEAKKDFHSLTPFLLPGVGRGSVAIIAAFVEISNINKKGAPDRVGRGRCIIS